MDSNCDGRTKLPNTVESEIGETGGLKFAEAKFGLGIYRPPCVESAWGKVKTAALSSVRNGLQQRFSNFFQVGTTFISQNVRRTTLHLGLSNSLGLP